MIEPVKREKQEFAELIERISAPDSPVGIDAQYTHAIIIEYLREIRERLDQIEARMS
jgi:hypothetical protein